MKRKRFTEDRILSVSETAPGSGGKRMILRRASLLTLVRPRSTGQGFRIQDPLAAIGIRLEFDERAQAGIIDVDPIPWVEVARSDGYDMD